MNELQKRIITAVVLLLFSIVWMFCLPEPLFTYVTALIGFLMTLEMLRLLGLRPVWPYIAIAAIVFGLLASHMALAHMFVLCMALWMLPFLFSGQSTENLKFSYQIMLASHWMMLWLVLFVWMLLQLHQQANGIAFLCGAFLGVWASDIGAYFTGKKWGRRKLCAAVSPGKSWEGFAGGLIAGVGIAASFWVFTIHMDWYVALFLSMVLVVTGVVGDLLESALKRSVDAKDSGISLPGHGGALDRLDSLITAVPVTGLLWMAVQ
ncbi:MAG: phosphatidate cytidylyltransferase [Zetaproteobacteria bacterium CG_4_9_14_3_um_filter_49_83]|nr:MAG: hypothetical protein AUJ56_11735 [Zetaproteobacteria bacterium CG1_02_49_23]PIQ34170.1 MAG: phosphatidate cytidylyltransferase [Zetaproteobacteria bacterium CG17_big_fil_post_rev_8_21_14_2_50_50_13]PIV31232.1 MAG: phosphatidate cytidylyltransferase [Zetaproteobacteria bacterium CG02_land_8_20_14_3_00_50_9]PIY56945.1 MAG: phosphatidate cytidylyltransferase [Zetaproteobacteria bacterium CG_4_10_14_0_8_um_filter_49_80]PJA35342.1 MAG: phosphatidate cytidylyltransferase [Zetaproteobacteria b